MMGDYTKIALTHLLLFVAWILLLVFGEGSVDRVVDLNVRTGISMALTFPFTWYVVPFIFDKPEMMLAGSHHVSLVVVAVVAIFNTLCVSLVLSGCWRLVRVTLATAYENRR